MTAPSQQVVPLEQRFDRDTQSYAFVIPRLPPVTGVGGIRAIDCANCHRDIYNEWRASTHATALRDIQFQAELAKEESPKWICLNCHIPLQNQRDSIVTGLLNNDILQPVKMANPGFDYSLQQEAITCATCHVRTDSAGNSYIIGAIGSPFAPHPVKKDQAFLRNICLRCHNPQGEGLTRNLICWFETKKETEEAQAVLEKKFGGKRDCTDCHMPAKERHITIYDNLPKRHSHQHHWTGSGIPKWYEGYDSLLARGYVPGLDTRVGALRVGKPALRSDSMPGLDTTRAGDITGARPGSTMTVEIELTNARAGHYLPTADPERFLLVVAEITDNTGRSVKRHTHRIGQTWEWNPARKIGDNRLAQGETYVWEPVFQLPAHLPELKLVVTVLHVRLSTHNAAFMKKTKNINESLFENGQHYVQNIEDYYPFASFLFKEEIIWPSGERKLWTLKELIELSKKEKGMPPEKRGY